MFRVTFPKRPPDRVSRKMLSIISISDKSTRNMSLDAKNCMLPRYFSGNFKIKEFTNLQGEQTTEHGSGFLNQQQLVKMFNTKALS